MKTFLFAVATAIALIGCDSGMSGEFGCSDSLLFKKLTLKRDGTAYVMLVSGMEQSGQHKIDGDRVVITIGGQGFVFTKKGNALETGEGMMQTKCVKL